MNSEKELPLPKNWLIRFSTIWAGQAVSLFGSMLVQFALVWWLTAQTGSATVLAVATLVALLPTVLIGPIAGAFVDRHSRRWMMVIADSLVALVTLWLVILNALGWMQVGHVFAAMFLRAAAGTFQWPAMQASTSLMVPKKHLARVGGLNQTLYGLLGIVAPPTGALLVMALPMQWVLAIDLITAALAVLPLLVIGVPQPPAVAEEPDRTQEKSARRHAGRFPVRPRLEGRDVDDRCGGGREIFPQPGVCPAARSWRSSISTAARWRWAGWTPPPGSGPWPAGCCSRCGAVSSARLSRCLSA